MLHKAKDKRLNVAVGILFNQDSQVLIGQRTVKDAYFEQWEFPGGKLESGESAEQAIQRELNEELGIQVKKVHALLEHEFDYPDKAVRLFVMRIIDYEGEVMAQEGQALQWMALEKLSAVRFLKGNQAIIDFLQKRIVATEMI